MSRRSTITTTKKISSGGNQGSSLLSGGGGRSFSSHSLTTARVKPIMSSCSMYAGRGGYGGFGHGMRYSMGCGLGGGYSAHNLGGGYGYGGGISIGSLTGGSGIVGNEKDTMQNLNERLANYLSKVQSLQDSNRLLEKKIREASSGSSIDGFDWSIYDTTVKPLQLQIQASIMDSARIALEIDNAKLAAEDFRSKWEHELMLRQSVENDIGGLHQLKETYLQLQAGLTNDIAAMEDEIAYLRKNHAEELRILRQQKTSDVQVEVDSKPSINLQEVLNKIREDYNAVVLKNQNDMENWYKVQLETRSVEQAQGNQALEAARHEVSEYRRQMQNLQAEYDALLGSIGSLEASLRDTEIRYDQQLQGYMCMVSNLEGELMRIRNEINLQVKSYQDLLNIKMKLEQEISVYRQLLDGGGQSVVSSSSGGSGMSSSTSMQSGGTGGSQIITMSTTTKESKIRY
ncbi:keratin, type I cytoskeletal 18 isoform X1 [Callorhinchus milii]|uniref:keratin, type I cytoskeletal 18 isoform X1 n=2 Tax=Callorhinchus milii TaxID=7868 RepID=UPI0004571C6D|nr:keratin, type I cytoskeletal 18 isoform X1 [Callorhinchus milii]|eukprot:gi/632977320/ref/XP_007905281.1/ PREDICTED: keratin, type I cytoskeletal 18-like isoform X1 [Callorhinchus milii]